MTIIVVRNGIMACDSRVESGGVIFKMDKMIRKADALLGIAGDIEPAMVFVDWFGTGGPLPAELAAANADFSVLALTKSGMFEYDKWCKGLKVRGRFHAIGSGAAAALGALHMGATARNAARIACKLDANCGPPIITMSLK